MEEEEITQENFHPSETVKTESMKGWAQALSHEFREVLTRDEEVAERIAELLKYREDRTYHLLASDRNHYFSSMWNHLQKHLAGHSPYFEPDLLAMFSQREANIISDIMEQRLEIEMGKSIRGEGEEQLKQKKLNMLRDQSSQIQRKLLDINESMEEIKGGQQGQSRFKPFEIKEEKLKEYQDFIRKQKKEKEERAKAQEDLKKKEIELLAKKQQQQRELKEKQLRQRKEELLKKVREGQEKREKERMQRQQRHKDYKFISKSLAQQPPLFKKLEQNYYHRYQQSELQNRKKAISERHSMFEAVDTKAIQEHERKYEDMRAEKERQRRQRLQDYQKMLEMQQEEIQSKYKSSFQLKTAYVDKRVEERRIAQQKREKIKKFIEQTVKQRYLPRIDQQKRKEFLKIIENLHGNKKLRKVKREDGSYEYQEVKPSDPKMVGLEYLELTKEMAAKMRGKRKHSDNAPSIDNEKPRVFDYLAEQRKKSSKSHRDRLEFVNRKGLSFDEKLKKVELQSEKLQELAKQKEMKLKFGKFSTSDQILQHKEEIDQHYIDIINMKLKLINHQ